MKFSFKKLMAVILTVAVMTLVTIGVSAAGCAGNNHSFKYTVVDGAFNCTCQCGATNAVSEKNSEGGPVIYLGTTYESDGTTVKVSGGGMTPTAAISTAEELVNLFKVYKGSGAAKPITVVVTGVFAAAAEFSIDAGTTVTFTSTWNGVNYASKENGYARLYLNTNVHCYNDMVFDKVIFEHPKAGRYIGLNGHNLTVTGVQYYSAQAKNGIVTKINSTAMYGILAGDYLNKEYPGESLSNLNQVISVDSGMWICIDVGFYRSITASAFHDMSGKVTINLSGNAQVINRATGNASKYRGLSAASQIVSAKGLDVVYNISGGKYVLNTGINVIGRDSQAPKAARNINATYNISGGDFGECAVYSTVRSELTNSIPTKGKVVFNVLAGVNLGEHFIDNSKDAYNVFKEMPKGYMIFVPVRKYENQFADVTADKWFAKYVETAYELGLASGTSGARFSPDQAFTVAQALTVAANIHKAYYGTTIGAAEAGEEWFTPYAEYCEAYGIIARGRFANLNDEITRGEMAMVFANILPDVEYQKLKNGTNPDVASDAEYAAAVTKLYQAGIVGGDDKGNYRPGDKLLRSEACVIFTRIAVSAERAK